MVFLRKDGILEGKNMRGYKARGSNQYAKKHNLHYLTNFAVSVIMLAVFVNLPKFFPPVAQAELISPAPDAFAQLPADAEASNSASLIQEATNPDQEKLELQQPTELEVIVAYIARVFEPEGKDVVVKAINCFYSESGLRTKAVGQNKDVHKSKDWGVAQLNDYWHNLTTDEKTEYKANIEKAYEIYKSRGNFSAWYGKLCK